MVLKRLLALLGLGAAAAAPSAARTLSSDPDRPAGFGYKVAWFAIRSEDTEAVSQRLGLLTPVAANWASGLAAVRETPLGQVAAFVAPPVDGWTLAIVTLDVAAETPEKTERLIALLEDLSRAFGEAQYFGTYRVVDYHAWFRAVDGRIARGFSWCPESDGVLANTGAVTEIERTLGFAGYDGLSEADLTEELFSLEEDDATLSTPDEEAPAAIAAAWSLDPLTLDGREDIAPATGLFGALSAAWGATRPP